MTIRQIRQRAGMNVSEFSRATGIDRRDIYALESGMKRCFDGWKQKIATVVPGIDPRDIH